MNLESAAEVARRIADALEHAGIPHAIGGALALGIWGFPRATNDVDVDIFVAAEEALPAVEILRRIGVEIDAVVALRSARERGDFRGYAGRVRVDVFVSSIPLYESARQRIRRAPLLGRPAWFLAPEDLAIFKLLFFRAKDLLDVERMLAFQGSAFDRIYVRRWLVDLVGEEDDRTSRWDAMVASIDG